MTAETVNPAPVARALSNKVLLGSIGIRVLVNAQDPEALFLQARDVRFFSPKAENLQDALQLLGVFLPADRERVIGGMFAGIALSLDELKAGNAVARMLAEAVEAYKASIAAALTALDALAVATASPAEA